MLRRSDKILSPRASIAGYNVELKYLYSSPVRSVRSILRSNEKAVFVMSLSLWAAYWGVGALIGIGALIKKKLSRGGALISKRALIGRRALNRTITVRTFCYSVTLVR